MFIFTEYERRLVAFYLDNLASRLSRGDSKAAALTHWLSRHRDVLPSVCRDMPIADLDGRADSSLTVDEWRGVQAIASRAREATRPIRRDPLARRLTQLGQRLQLSRVDSLILELLLRHRLSTVVEDVVDSLFDDHFSFRRRPAYRGDTVFCCLLGVSLGACRERLNVQAPLVRQGLVSVDDDGAVTVNGRLKRLAHSPDLFDPAPRSELEWSDFDHVGPGRDHVESLVRGAVEAHRVGVNVLVYGPPGTGKTEFCRVLARRLGLSLFAVGEVDEHGFEPRRAERLQALRIAQSVLAGSTASLLLFDEMEDLLEPPLPFASARFEGPCGGSKVFIHRLLEQTPLPTLWTSNCETDTSPAVLRRMMFALELRKPSRKVRTRIWQRQLSMRGIDIGEDEAAGLARDYDITPGVAAGATQGARLAGDGDLATVRCGVQSLSRVLHGDRPPRGPAHRFDPALTRADIDLSALADRLAARGPGRCSLCLQGPPGTGKSGFVRYLADRIGLEVVQKRASDLLSMWVGLTEQKIAQAFAEARDTEQFLIFDEAESLLEDRRFAFRSWETTRVNEMLTWMESHPLPFACTTNFRERLDPATLRRFDFKISLGFLAAEQVELAFRSFFGLEPPQPLATLDNLTPGDFALVRRKAEVLDCLRDPIALAEMLSAECDAKPDHRRAIGFRAA